MKKWVAFFSQTGSEISDLISYGYRPSLIVTNKSAEAYHKLISYQYFLKHNIPVITSFTNTPEAYDRLFNGDQVMITLHGYLKIVPPEACRKYEIYNGHPALLTLYPELKGKDKQKDIVNNSEKYPWIGSVIHKVDPELDAGELLYSCKIKNTATTEDEAYKILRRTSFDTWKVFFDRYFNDKPIFEGQVIENTLE